MNARTLIMVALVVASANAFSLTSLANPSEPRIEVKTPDGEDVVADAPICPEPGPLNVVDLSCSANDVCGGAEPWPVRTFGMSTGNVGGEFDREDWSRVELYRTERLVAQNEGFPVEHGGTDCSPSAVPEIVAEISFEGHDIRGVQCGWGGAGVRVRLGLREVDETRTLLLPTGRSVTAQFDAWAVLDGKKVATEFKTGMSAANGIDTYDQMERQLAVAQRLADLEPQAYAKEIHWRFDSTPAQGARDNALALREMYPDMKIRFFTADGFEVPIV